MDNFRLIRTIYKLRKLVAAFVAVETGLKITRKVHKFRATRRVRKDS